MKFIEDTVFPRVMAPIAASSVTFLWCFKLSGHLVVVLPPPKCPTSVGQK